jgi:transposase-like protein
MRDVSKEVIETLLEGELTDHLGFEKCDQKAKTVDNSRLEAVAWKIFQKILLVSLLSV